MNPNSTYTFSWDGDWRHVWYRNAEMYIDRDGNSFFRPIDVSGEELDPGDTSEIDNFLNGFITT